MRGCKFFALIFVMILACVPVSVFSADDSTSFNPVPITIMAKGGGGVPVGTVIAWPVATNPGDIDNWLECNGQSISAAVYPELAAIIGGNVPDYRGLFLRGHGSQAYAQMNGSQVGFTTTTHSSGALGAVQGDAIRNISGQFGNTEEQSAYFSGAFYPIGTLGGAAPDDYAGVNVVFDTSRVVPTASENRPVNRAVRYLIRAKS